MSSGYRSTQVRFGDTLQLIALRELGDGARWAEIAYLNELRPPYIVQDAALAAKGLTVVGNTILLPIEAKTPSGDTNDRFLTDLSLSGGLLSAENGDLVLVADVKNLTQAIRHRISVEKRDMIFHPEYGCWVHTVIGQVNGPAAGRLAAFYVKSALLEDERIRTVDSCDAVISGDQIAVTAYVTPVYGESFAFSEVF